MKKLLFSDNFPTKMVSGLLLLAVCGGCRFVDPYWRVHPESVVDGASVFPTNEWGGYYPTQWRKWSDDAPKSKSPEPVVIPLSTQKPLPPPLLIKPREQPVVNAPVTDPTVPVTAPTAPVVTPTAPVTAPAAPVVTPTAPVTVPLTTNKTPVITSPTTTPETASSGANEASKPKFTNGINQDPNASVEIDDWGSEPVVEREAPDPSAVNIDPNDPAVTPDDLRKFFEATTLQEMENEKILRERETQSPEAPLTPSTQTVVPDVPTDLPEVNFIPSVPSAPIAEPATEADPVLPVLDPTVSDIRQPSAQLSTAFAPVMKMPMEAPVLEVPAVGETSVAERSQDSTVWVPLESPEMGDTSVLSVQFSQQVESNEPDELPTISEDVLTPETAAMNVLVGPMRPITGPVPQNWDRASWNPYAKVCNSQLCEDCR